ncbi:Hypothetical predicted protein [Podarcis lilfordi]|uniref:Uncharacterized protein n=1 Tax=Podarcis lilfordi TaxID=74358 RepID=A0AA35PQ78_9SAUR|nr:Hypothetical predicted protein [Podarcis lilfordi]
MEGANGFGIDSILSHRAGSPAVPKGEPLMGEGRSPLELSPRSEISSGCPSPHSPGRECLEAVAQRQGVAVGLESHLQAGQILAPSQSRTVTSSFLIRDILADCKPLAACAPYSSSNGQSAQEAPVRIPPKSGEDFREKMDKNNSSNSSSDTEYKENFSMRPRNNAAATFKLLVHWAEEALNGASPVKQMTTFEKNLLWEIARN